MNKNKPFDDIRSVDYPFKTTRSRMSMHDRASQFSPFAALTGYDSLIEETARLTDSKIDLDETEKEKLDRAISELRTIPNKKINVTFFLPDGIKSGGAYLSLSGMIKRIDDIRKSLVMDDMTVIPLDDVISLRIDE